ncbi:PREDICTED: uncharacterized protein LOC108563907 [Nicrophorus vespilloides]|uniref:Uncharacterized protein LOC108563907 n=1 Tax=Nicrophorus vespilloides TaxID=110193 RepID=A0ABM1MUG1_NICVS|nr:PREDICTED: uncharacterized protein LOC108563907 [Nicrophorus vespilloides]
MFKFVVLAAVFFCAVQAAPKLRVMTKQMPAPLLTLPSNATSIRADIDDSFSCEGREYGYYADVENECQLFHVCLPVTYSNGRSQTFRWSFICPEETVFNQEIFTCTRSDESIDCADSPRYYNLNTNFGDDLSVAEVPAASSAEEEQEQEQPASDAEEETVVVPEVAQDLEAPVMDSLEEAQPLAVAELAKSPTPFMYNRRVMKV